MDEHFPRVAQLFRECGKFWEAATVLNGKGVSMEFGSLFFCMAINLDLGVPVKLWPHRDLMNLAVGLCVIYIFGRPVFQSIFSFRANGSVDRVF